MDDTEVASGSTQQRQRRTHIDDALPLRVSNSDHSESERSSSGGRSGGQFGPPKPGSDGRGLFTLSFPGSGSSREIHPSFQKPSPTFRKLSETFDEFQINFVYAKVHCFRMCEVHREFIEVSGKSPAVSGMFLGVSRNQHGHGRLEMHPNPASVSS